MPKKRNKHSATKDIDSSYDEAVDSLADVVAEELQDHPHTALDPFDIYADAVKERARGDMSKFRSRFAHGYHVLLEEVQKEE